MINTQSIFQQFKSEWKLTCQDDNDVQGKQDEVLDKYRVYADNDPDLNELIEEFINIMR